MPPRTPLVNPDGPEEILRDDIEYLGYTRDLQETFSGRHLLPDLFSEFENHVQVEFELIFTQANPGL